jgi:TatD DNase family protein
LSRAPRDPKIDPMRLVDSHSHIDAPEFDADRDAVLARARAAGVVAQVVPAVAAAGWDALRTLARAHPELKPAYGLHPVHLDAHQPSDLDRLARWLGDERPVAVGECGLDFFVDGLDPGRQRACFVAQLELAREFDLPVVVHARRAVEEVIATVRRIGGLRGVVHSYGGSAEQARQLHGLGFRIGIGGPITFERANRLRSVVVAAPLSQLLLETDAPDQPDAVHRGQRNEPARLPHVLAAVAAARGEPEERIADATSDNARELFRLD